MSYQIIWFPDFVKFFHAPEFFDGRYYYKVLACSSTNTTPYYVIYDTRTDQYTAGQLTGFGAPNCPPCNLLYRATRRKFGASLVIVENENQKIVIDQVDIDVSAGTATVSNIVSTTNTNISSEPIWDSVAIDDILLITQYPQPYIYVIDPYTGSTVKSIDTGFGSYRPRTGMPVTIRGDDVYVLVGRHLAGDPFRLLKLYAGTLTTISGSTVGGDSPHTWRSSIYLLGNRKLFTASGFSVVNSQPPIRWFNPRDFSVIGTTSLTSIYTYARAMGYWPIGEDDTYIYMVAILWDNTWNYETRRTMHIIRISKTDFTFADHTQLASFTERTTLIPGTYPFSLPILNRQKKILYIPVSKPHGGGDTNGIMKLDISNLPITEFNNMMYYVGEARRPTSLYLSASVV